MGQRSIILLIGAVLSLAASEVMALGLGKIKLESSLNQPLQAQIELFEVRDLTEEEIRVSIASREDFERIGVDKIYFLSDLQFDIQLEGAGSPVINVRSTKAVREPFLNFVIQVQWPSGKLLREYTLLLDLPVYSQEAAPVVQSTTTAPAQTTQPSQTTEQSNYNPRSVYEAAPARPSDSGPVSPSYTDDTYTVQSNDTLWEIAASVRPDRNVSIHQTMLAIQRSNPEAFINNNINLLKKGQILRIPERDDMSTLSQRDAVREVAVQNNAWSGDEVSGAQLSASDSYDDYSSDEGVREGRIKLTSPDDSYDSLEGRTSGGAADSSTDALENELAVTLEQLDSSSRENTELKSKVESLEEQIQTLERMLEVSNENLRALELNAQKTAEEEALADSGEEDTYSAETPSDDLSIADEVSSSLDDDLTSSLNDDLSSDIDGSIDTAEASLDDGISDELSTDADAYSEEVIDETSEELADALESTPTPTATPVANPKKVVSAAKPEKGIVDLILENVLYIAGGLIVLAAGAFFLLRQKSSDEEDFDDFMQDQGFESETEELPVADEAPEDDIDLGDFSDNFDDVSLEEPTEEVALEEQEQDSEPETEDVVAEADIYIAYGKFEQAEDMLLKSLAHDPSDQDVRLKLLEVYSNQGDAESFDPHFAKLRAFAAPNVLERAEGLRASIPNIADFDEGSFDTSDVNRFASEGEVEDERPEEDITQIMGDRSTPPELPDEDVSLDLDLGDLDSDGDPDSGFELDLPSEPVEEPSLDLNSTDDELDLDLDIDLPEGDEESSFDLELDLPSDDAESADTDLESLDAELDLATAETESLEADLDDLSLELPGGLEDTAEEDAAELDLGDLDLDSDSTLEADLAGLDADLDLSLDSELDEPEVESSDEPSFDLADIDGESLELTDELEGANSASDTVVNQALTDEYIEQKLSEDADADLHLDDALPLEVDSDDDGGQTQALDALDVDEDTDLDLSSLDDELNALTSDLDVDAEPASMDEPVTDFDDFEDELEKDEAMAETVKSEKAGTDSVENMGEDSVFDQAISEVPETADSDLEFELPDVDPEEVDDDDLDFLSDSDETATKLDLARAYIDMGDQEGARDIIREVMGEGNDEQKAEAEKLMAKIDG